MNLMLQELTPHTMDRGSVAVLDERAVLETLAEVGVAFTSERQLDPVLDRLLGGNPIGRIVGVDAMKYSGWQRLTAEYAKQFGSEMPGRTSQAAQKS